MDKCCKNEDPTTQKEKEGPKTPGIDHLVTFTGNKKDGDSKPTSDGKGHFSGH